MIAKDAEYDCKETKRKHSTSIFFPKQHEEKYGYKKRYIEIIKIYLYIEYGYECYAKKKSKTVDEETFAFGMDDG